MSVPAINVATTPPGPQAQPAAGVSGAAGASGSGGDAGAAFSALLGLMFGDQDSLAAQLFAGTKAGAKTPAADDGDAKTDGADASTQAQGLAAGFLTAPVALVDQAQAATSAAGAAPVDPDGGKAPTPGLATPTTPGDAQAQQQAKGQTTTATAQATTRDAKPAQPGAALPASTDAVAPAAAQTGQAQDASAQVPTGQTPAAAAAAAAAQANAHAAAPGDKTPAVVDDKTAKPADAVGAAAAPQAAVVQASADADPQGGAGAGADKDGKPAAPPTELPKEAAASDRRDAATPAPPPPALNPTAAANAAATPVRSTPETVAHLAAQIAKHLDGRTSQFDIQLSPAGLGHVGVRVEISAHGQLTAAMSFDNAHAAAEVRSRAAELTRALEQAGFDVSGGLSFDVASDQGRSGYSPPQQNNDDSGAWRGRAFQAAVGAAGETLDAAVAGALNLQRRSQTGVDIRI